MNIRSILALAAVVLAGAAGAASAADRFAVMDGVAAQAMTQSEMAGVAGTFLITRVTCFTCGGDLKGTTVLRTTTFDNGAISSIGHALGAPHPKFPGTTNPSGNFEGWAGGL